MNPYLNNFFWLCLTYLFAPFFYSLIFLRKTKKKAGLKIIVIQTAKIGDMVCTTPIFREIKKIFPQSYLSVFIIPRAKDILVNNPYIDEIILTSDFDGIRGRFNVIKKLRKDKYDWSFNLLPGSFNGILSFWSFIPNRISTTYKHSGRLIGFLSIFSNYRLEYISHIPVDSHYLKLLKFIGIENPSAAREVFITSREDKAVLDFLSANDLNENDLLVGISVVPGNKMKQWDLNKFSTLADALCDKLGAKILFIGSADDKSRIQEVQSKMKNKSVDASGVISLRELPALLKKMKLFISTDSGPLYIADAIGTPVVNIGGSIDARAQSPAGKKFKIVQKYNYEGSFLNISSSDAKKYYENVNSVTVEEVVDAASNLLFNS